MRNKKSQNGFTIVEIAIVIVVLGLLSGGIALFLHRQNSSNNAQQEVPESSSNQANVSDTVAEGDELPEQSVDAPSDESAPADNDTGSSAPDSEPAQSPTPASAPKEPTPNYSLYESNPEIFKTCPATTTAYVVNPSGAQLAVDYYSTNYVKTIGFGTKVETKCQDGTGPSSMMIILDGNTYMANPADFRTTYPYTN